MSIMRQRRIVCGVRGVHTALLGPGELDGVVQIGGHHGQPHHGIAALQALVLDPGNWLTSQFRHSILHSGCHGTKVLVVPQLGGRRIDPDLGSAVHGALRPDQSGTQDSARLDLCVERGLVAVEPKSGFQTNWKLLASDNGKLSHGTVRRGEANGVKVWALK